MKKSFWGALIAIFLFSGSLFGVKAWGISPTSVTGEKNGGVGISSRVGPAGTNIGSLPTALKSVLSQTLGANDPRYRLSPSDGEYRAVNGRNGFSATIGLHGFTVRSGANQWGLRLAAWGRGGGLKNVGAGRVASSSNRVAINRGGITEWWVNGPVGIEQGWTLDTPPRRGDNGGRLTLLLRQSGDLRAQALSHGSSLLVLSNSGRQVLRYTGLKAYDKNGKLLPAHFVVARRYVRLVVDDTNAVYPVRIDPWVVAAELTASDGAAGDGLGSSVAVSADGSTVVAGAPFETIGSDTGQGALYVFKEPASGWASGTQVAKLTAFNGDSAHLGASVAVSADGSTIVAGALINKYEANTIFGQGAVYVFQEPASGWVSGSETAKLIASDGAAGDYLGSSLAVSSNGSTVVAGAPDATVGGNGYQGAVYVFEKPASGWVSGTQTAKLTASDGAEGDALGYSVAVDAAGSTVAAGEPNADVGYNSAQGAVYVFKEPASGWTDVSEAAKLTPSDGASDESFGRSVAESPDGSTVVAGAPDVTVGSNYAQGAVYVFNEPASGWASGTEAARLTASDGASGDNLGSSLAVSANGAIVVAGAPMATVGGVTQQGAVYAFNEPATGWANETETARLRASAGVVGDQFGASVAVSSGGATIVAGAPYETVGTHTEQGAAYLFQGPFWQNALDFGGGWKLLSWFGNFNTNPSPWIYHQKLGSLFPIATSTESIWFYDPQWDGAGGWWWTNSSFFPWIYSVTENEWLYFDAKDSTPSARWFFTAAGQASTH